MWERRLYTHLEQSRSGVVGVGIMNHLFGGGVYDGDFNLNPIWDSNWITRAYFIPALHPDPKQIYMIGLGSGSWAWAIVQNTDLEKLTVVEINPAYFKLWPNFPEHETLLTNPKVDLIVDDGRLCDELQ